jgi:23S rRNA pseudouridine1911/1915/1917 synthase
VSTEQVPAALDGERVDRVVAMITGCSRAEAADAVEAGHVRLDGRVVVKGATKVTEGQVIDITVDPVRQPEPPRPDPAVTLEVVYEDDEVIVIDKPAGLVVHPAAGNEGATLVNGLLARYPELADLGGDPGRPGIVHRLDKGTSGLLVVARTDDARDELIAQLATHEVDRHYAALTWGHFETSIGTIDAPVGRSRRDPLRMTVQADGRPARTHYEVQQRFEEPPTTLLECRLETGRTHQIRVHLRSIGRPVVGDDLYGGVRDVIPTARPFLHAKRLRFDHPRTAAPMDFESPLPADLVAILSGLGE